MRGSFKGSLAYIHPLAAVVCWEEGTKGGKGDWLRSTLSQGVVELLFGFRKYHPIYFSLQKDLLIKLAAFIRCKHRLVSLQIKAIASMNENLVHG